MRLLIIAVGQGLPAWANSAVEEYARRFPPPLRPDIQAVRTEPRGAKNAQPTHALLLAERQRIQSVLDKAARSSSGLHTVALDERGQSLSTRALAGRWQAWQDKVGLSGTVALAIGGPDGLDEGFKQAAHERIRLSDLTLPHALARVLLLEQLWRAWSITTGHPYHRE